MPAGTPSAGQLNDFIGYTPAATSLSASNRRKTDCGLNAISESPEEVGERLLRQELEHDLVAAARDQALAVHVQDAGKAAILRAEGQAEYARNIVHAAPRTAAPSR